MQKLLMLGSAFLAPEIIECAKKMGVYTITTDYMPYEQSRAKQLSDEYWMISIVELDILEEKCRQEGITAITCGISEFCQDIAFEMCERLGLPCYATKDAWRFNRDKSAFKEVCKKVGAPVATDYYLTDALTDAELDAVQFPVVVKPVDKCSNIGVSFCNNKEELIEAYHYARSISNNSTIIVERRITGLEYMALYVLCDGEPSLFGLVTNYADPSAPTYCYMINTSINPHVRHYLDEVDDYARKVLKGVGCTNGFVWLQLMHDYQDGNDYMIEMGYRLSGDLCFMPLSQLRQFDPIQWMVECALGVQHIPQDLPEQQTDPLTECACAYILWTSKTSTITEIRGLDELAKIPGVHIVEDAMPADKCVDLNRPLCCIMFTGKDCDEMCKMIDLVNQKVAYIDEHGENIARLYTDFETLKNHYDASLAQ